MKAIVVVARGLQASALGCYGNSWIETPALDVLAAGGVVFDQHFADSADAAGARRAWRSGRYHLSASSAAGPDLLAALRERGIHTCLILDDSRTSPEDFTHGWDAVERVAAGEERMPLEATLEAVGAALERLEQRENWLLWIDLAPLVPPWEVPEEFVAPYFEEAAAEEEDEDEEAVEIEPLMPLADRPAGPIDPEDDTLFLSLQASYAAAVSYLDAGLGSLLEALEGLEGGGEVLLLFTSDVGQDLGEHGDKAHRLHEEIVHLPLLLRLPEGAEAGRRVGALTQAVDVAATLAEFFQSPLPDAHGGSLLTLARGEETSSRTYAVSAVQVGEAAEYALRTPEWALLLPAAAEGVASPPRLFVKPDDRWEVNDVVQHHLDRAERYEQTVRAFVTASCQPGPLRPPPLPEMEDAPAASEASAENPASE